jgi:hypothetical protein
MSIMKYEAKLWTHFSMGLYSKVNLKLDKWLSKLKLCDAFVKG